MEESMGPCEADCPARILDLLTPTDKEYAREWRTRCRANLEFRARQLADGDRIRLPEPMTFSDGNVLQEFVVAKRGRRVILRDPPRGGSEERRGGKEWFGTVNARWWPGQVK